MSRGLLGRLRGLRGGSRSGAHGAGTINFMILGSRRSGTTSLEYYLGEHPQVRFLGEADLAPIGGVARGLPFNPPLTALSHPVDRAARAYAEACAKWVGRVPCLAWRAVYALYFPHVIDNLAEQLPDLRIVLSLRDPADTTYSVWCRQRERSNTDADFEASIGLPAEPLQAPAGAPSWRRWYPRPSGVPSSVARGMYAPFLRRLFDRFPREQVHAFPFHDLERDARGVVEGIARFLDLDAPCAYRRVGDVRSPSAKPAPMPETSRAKLNEVFRDANRQLFDVLGWPADTWGVAP